MTDALEELRHLGAGVPARDAVAVGVTWRDLYVLRDDGRIIEFSRGLCQVAGHGLEHLYAVTVCGRVPDGTICLDSALAHWDLSDENPR